MAGRSLSSVMETARFTELQAQALSCAQHAQLFPVTLVSPSSHNVELLLAASQHHVLVAIRPVMVGNATPGNETRHVVAIGSEQHMPTSLSEEQISADLDTQEGQFLEVSPMWHRLVGCTNWFAFTNLFTSASRRALEKSVERLLTVGMTELSVHLHLSDHRGSGFEGSHHCLKLIHSVEDPATVRLVLEPLQGRSSRNGAREDASASHSSRRTHRPRSDPATLGWQPSLFHVHEQRDTASSPGGLDISAAPQQLRSGALMPVLPQYLLTPLETLEQLVYEALHHCNCVATPQGCCHFHCAVRQLEEATAMLRMASCRMDFALCSGWQCASMVCLAVNDDDDSECNGCGISRGGNTRLSI